MEDFG
jgi:hypothetical protein